MVQVPSFFGVARDKKLQSTMMLLFQRWDFGGLLLFTRAVSAMKMMIASTATFVLPGRKQMIVLGLRFIESSLAAQPMTPTRSNDK